MPLFNLAGKRPNHIGAADGRLASCPANKANCVVSLHAEESRTEGPHHVAPFSYEGDPGDAMTRVLAVLMQAAHCRIVSNRSDYIHAEFTSSFFGFVDDVEFLLSAAERVIHVRSASRLGLSDFGVNRARVETLREAFDGADD